MTGLFPLRPLQQHALDGLRQSILAGKRRVVIQAPTGFGKCLGLGTKVMKFDGSTVPVEEICAGDELMGPDSTPRRVLSTCRGLDELFRIVPVKGAPWVCNSVHVLTLVNIIENKIVDVPLNEYLNKNKTFKWVHKQFSPAKGVDFANPKDPDIDPYWLGLWVGDGTKSLRGVAVTKPDIEVYEACAAIAETHGLSIRTDGPSNGKCETHHIHGGRHGNKENILLDKLRGLFGYPTVSFPLRLKTASRIYREEFLAGAIDSDGYVKNGCVEIAQRNVEFAEGIAFVARSLGFKVTVCDKIVNGTTYKRMILSGEFSAIETRIPRKKIGPRKQIKTATRTGFDVVPIGLGEYAGFELDGDGRFLLGDFTVTHNTILAAHMAAGALAKRNRTAFVVPQISLVDQTVTRFIQNGIDPGELGVMQADHPLRRSHAPLQICSIQTLDRRGFPDVRFVIVDECHINFKAIERWQKERLEVLFVGLSATPWSKGMGDVWDDLIVPTTLRDLIEQGWLAKFRVFAAANKVDLSAVKIVAGEFHEGQLSEAMSNKTIVADVISTWLEKGENRPTLLFAVDRAHAAMLHEQFSAAGVGADYIDGETPREERQAILDRYRRGEVTVICSVLTMTTGVDIPCRCIVDAAPTKSEIRHCLDAETEILTSQGWKGMGEVCEGDCVASCVGSDNRVGQWALVKGAVIRPVEKAERWIEYSSDHANLRVTDSHRMIFATGKRRFGFGPASEMAFKSDGVRFPTAVTIHQPGVPITADELYFIGMMMTDGTWGTTQAHISQSERHPEIVQKIESVLKRLRISYVKSPVKSPVLGQMPERYRRWRFNMPVCKPTPRFGVGRFAPHPESSFVQGERGFRHLLPYLDKDLSPVLLAASKEQFLALLDGIWDGDGSKKKNADYQPHTRQIVTVRKIMADRLQALCAINGIMCNMRQYDPPGRKRQYILSFIDKDWRHIGGTGRAIGFSVSEPIDGDMCWCVESSTGTIVTRRRGKVAVMGNCQKIGRGLRNEEGKTDLIILDHAGNCQRLGMPTSIGRDTLRTAATDAKEAEKGDTLRKEPLPRECRSCNALLPAKTRVCPSCGSEMRRASNVEVVDGELTELGTEAKPKGKETAIERLRKQGKQAVYSQINAMGDKRGWSPGKKSHLYRDIFGVWPRELNETRMNPTPELMSYEHSKRIAWANSQKLRRKALDATKSDTRELAEVP